MLVPQHWAEARIQSRVDGRQVTVRRFGWSESSVDDAQVMAQARTREAFEVVLSGGRARRTEPKVPYNGADGVPIREEVVARHGVDVVTRNSYGARCLNTPDVWFADVDFGEGVRLKVVVLAVAMLAVGAGVIGVWRGAPDVGLLAALLLILGGHSVGRAVSALQRVLFGDGEKRARRRVQRFVARRADWRVRVHRTPAGLRLVALHRTFDPNEPECVAAFRELGVDPIYATMCRRQRCFRARLTAKPWRIGIASHMKPRPGTWPIEAGRRAERDRWVERYESVARQFAACQFEEEVGAGSVDDRASAVSALHDELAGATRGLPIA